MKSYSSKFALNSVAFGLAMAATFIACGDENTTKVNESTGLDVIAKGDTLPQCGSDNAGDMFFVVDSSAVYYCAGEKWSMLNGKDGEQGDKGGQGEPGDAGDSGKDGDEGASCTAKIVEAGIEVTCGDTVIGTIKNGETGDAIEGKKGNSCSATQDEKTKNVTITCETDDGNGVTYTVVNGTDGKSAYELSGSELTLGEWLASFKGETGKNCTIANYENTEKGESGYKITCGKDEKIVLNGTNANPGVGCSLDESEGNGVVKVICGEGENESTAILYKAVCGTEGYDPETQICDTRDNHVYKTVTIGKQTWMAENLNYAYTGVKFSKSFDIAYESDSTSWCYENQAANCATYGRLYTWAAAIDSVALEKDGYTCGYLKNCDRLTTDALAAKPVQGVCPSGWHLPSYAEWDALQTAVGGEDVAGKALKSSTGWTSGEASDKYGFSALPVGEMNGLLGYNFKGESAFFWSASQNNSYNNAAYRMGLHYDKESANLSYKARYDGFSVRCLKD